MQAARWKSILAVVTDPFAREQPALAKAAAIARRCRARLTLFNSFMIPQPITDVPMDSRQAIIDAASRQRRTLLQQLARSQRVRGAKCLVQWDYPAHEAIVRQVLRLGPDLLVTDSHRHGRLARAVLANTDWELMRNCPCPMWFVRSASLPKRPQVLVAVDPRHTHAKPSRLDDRLLQTAGALVRQLDGRIDVVHAYETPASAVRNILTRRMAVASQDDQDFIAKTTQAVHRLGAKYGIDPGACTVREGATREVVATAASRADILVMGAVSRSMTARPVIGSTAESVIDHVDCDVLVVKPQGFKTPIARKRTA